MVRARSAIFSTSSSAIGPTATTAEIAMQRSPAEPKPALTIASAARSRSASGRITAWFFAPPRACTRLPAAVPVAYTYRAIGVDPTKLIDLIAVLVSSSSTTVLSPCSTLNTPGGSPASAHSSASHNDADGSFSLGLSTTVLPAAMAIGKNHIGTIAGKLNGEMMPTGPSGWRTEYTSTLVDAFSVNPPLSRCGMPQANSTTSWPRLISPRASESTLPCSLVRILASSPLRALSSSRKLNMIAVRLVSEVSRQAGNAAAAASMTARASSTLPSATSPVTSPVAGLVTAAVLPPVPG